MIRNIGPGRTAVFALAVAVWAATVAAPAMAQTSHGSRSTSQARAAAKEKPAAKASNRRSARSEPVKPSLIDRAGDWEAYAAVSGKSRTCYALGKPKERKPELKRDQAYLFVSTRPGESVNNEVSIIMGFDVKPNSTPTAQIGTASYELVAKGSNLWLANIAKNDQFVEAMRKGAALIVKAPSTRGNVTTDTYSLKGISQALDRVGKECS
jgi:hypothetical protein